MDVHSLDQQTIQWKQQVRQFLHVLLPTPSNLTTFLAATVHVEADPSLTLLA